MLVLRTQVVENCHVHTHQDDMHVFSLLRRRGPVGGKKLRVLFDLVA